jgi:hypothetical protein
MFGFLASFRNHAGVSLLEDVGHPYRLSFPLTYARHGCPRNAGFKRGATSSGCCERVDEGVLRLRAREPK